MLYPFLNRFYILLTLAALAFALPAAATPVLSNCSVTPGTLYAPGGKITISANVADATAAIGRVSVLLFRNGANYGSFNLAGDANGLYSGSYTLPKNGANTNDVWTVRIYAVNSANRSASSDSTVTILADTGPILTNVTVSPVSLPAAAGTIRISANAADPGIGVAKTSVLLLRNGANYGTFALSATGNDVFSGSYALPPNLSATPDAWIVRLVSVSVTNKTTTADVRVSAAVDTGATFSNLKVTPDALPAGGGTITVSATIADPGIGIAQATARLFRNGTPYATLNLTDGGSGLYSAATVLPADNVPAPNVWTVRLSAKSAANVTVTAPDAIVNQTGRRLTSVSGVLTLEENARPAQAVTLNFRTSDNGVSQNRVATLDANGAFSLTDIPQGTYKLAIKGYKWLQTTLPIDTIAGDATGLTVTLHACDADNNNRCDVLDFGILVNSWGSIASDPNSGYALNADFNDDGRVDVLDFGLMVNNYGATGDP